MLAAFLVLYYNAAHMYYIYVYLLFASLTLYIVHLLWQQHQQLQYETYGTNERDEWIPYQQQQHVCLYSVSYADLLNHYQHHHHFITGGNSTQSFENNKNTTEEEVLSVDAAFRPGSTTTN